MKIKELTFNGRKGLRKCIKITKLDIKIDALFYDIYSIAGFKYIRYVIDVTHTDDHCLKFLIGYRKRTLRVSNSKRLYKLLMRIIKKSRTEDDLLKNLEEM